MTGNVNTENVTARTVKKWGCIAGLLSLPVGIAVGHFVDPGRGGATGVSLGMMILAIRAFWHQRRQPWFWMAIAALSVAHIALIAIVPWSNRSLPAPALWPIGIADFAAICGFIKLVEKGMSQSAAKSPS